VTALEEDEAAMAVVFVSIPFFPVAESSLTGELFVPCVIISLNQALLGLLQVVTNNHSHKARIRWRPKNVGDVGSFISLYMSVLTYQTTPYRRRCVD